MYGESQVNFVNVLDELKLPYILAIRSNHALWLPQEEEVYQEPWQEFKRTFSNGTTEVRYMAKRWLEVFPIASLHLGFEQLTHRMNAFICPVVHQLNLQRFFPSA